MCRMRRKTLENEELRNLEEALPRLKEGEMEKGIEIKTKQRQEKGVTASTPRFR